MTDVHSCFVECPPRVPNSENSERAVETVETVSAELHETEVVELNETFKMRRTSYLLTKIT